MRVFFRWPLCKVADVRSLFSFIYIVLEISNSFNNINYDDVFNEQSGVTISRKQVIN